MSHYTDEQVKAFSSIMWRSVGVTGNRTVPEFLRSLSDAGITVTFPEPRFRVVQVFGTTDFCVEDSERPYHANTVARFYAGANGGPSGARAAADEYAERLNREAGS